MLSYVLGKGVKKDVDKSIELYSSTANKGNDAAQIILEDCAYMNSDEVKKDVERTPRKWKGCEKIKRNLVN